MAYAIENAAFGTAAHPNGINSGSAGLTSGITTNGVNRLVCILIGTGRSREAFPNSNWNIHNPTISVTASGLTFTRQVLDQWQYDKVALLGGSDASFPNANMDWTLFTAPAATAVSGLAWSSTQDGDGFSNNKCAFVFAISGLPDINDVDIQTPIIVEDLSGSASRPHGALTTSGEAVVIGAFTSGSGAGFSFTGISGYTLNQDTASGNGTTNVKWAIYSKVEPSAISAKDIGDPSATTSVWHGILLAIGSTDPINNMLATAVSAEVLHEGADANVRASAVTAAVLYTADSTMRASSLGLEVLRSVDEASDTVTALVTSLSAEVLHTGEDSKVLVSSVAAEILVSAELPPPLDGSRFLEANFQTKSNLRFAESDYDSIWSLGDRAQSGIMTFGEYNVTIAPGATMGSSHDGNYAFPLGSGLSMGAVTTESGVWFDFNGELVEIAGFKLIGTEELDGSNGAWALYGGTGIGQLFEQPYGSEFDAFEPGQLFYDEDTDLYSSEYLVTSRNGLVWSHYEFKPAYSFDADDSRFANEIHLRVAHSTLDGGDRRPTNGRPDKRVTFTMGPGWTFATTDSNINPQDALFDGVPILLGFPAPGGDRKNGLGGFSVIYDPVETNGVQTTVGSWFQFSFPRKVTFKHLLLAQFTQVEEYVGDVPQHWGTWHWEYSNNGTTWTSIGGPWSFGAGADFMVAPRTGNFGLDLPDGAQHWRMVLNSGPAFRSNYSLGQFIFNLDDPGNLVNDFRVDFTDDTDGLLPTVTITGASPYNISFTDGTDDALNFTISNVPNFNGSIAFTDGTSDALTAHSSLSPSIYPQTIVVATGRR